MKRFLSCFLMAAFVLMLAGVSKGDLVAHWSFDDPDDLGKDVSGNDNNGEVKNNVTWSEEGKIGGCAHFSVTDRAHIVVPHSDSLNMSEALTIEVWLNPDTVNAWMSFGVKGDFCWGAFVSAGGGVTLDAGSGNQWISSPGGLVKPEEWQHLVMAYDADASKIYHNGELSAEGPGIAQIGTNNEPVIIGGTGNNGIINRDEFNGFIDELRIYDHFLTEDEVQESMERTEAVEPGDKLAVTWGELRTEL